MKARVATIFAMVLFSLFCCLWEMGGQQKSKKYNFDKSLQSAKTEYIQQGYSMKLRMNNDGQFGRPHTEGINLEYPVGSGFEHLYYAHSIIGGRVSDSTDPNLLQQYIAVTRTGNGANLHCETTPIDSTFTNLTLGKDPGAISENDIICIYTDTGSRPANWNHRPLGIKIIQRSMAWKEQFNEPILPIEYTIINIGNKTLRDVIISFYIDADVGPTSSQDYFQTNYAGYWDSVRTLYFHNPIDSGSTPLGLTLINASRSFDSLTISYHWESYFWGNVEESDDSSFYLNFLSSQSEKIWLPSDLADIRGYLTFGKFPIIKPGDTIEYTIAFVSGSTLNVGTNSLKMNVSKALCMPLRHYREMRIPSPPLHITRSGNDVHLNWQWTSSDSGLNPVSNWDEYNDSLTSLPDTHWRKRNGPLGRIAGGRNFEGFRVWRLESDTFNVNRFQLLAQYDVSDDLNYGYQTGLQYTLVDSSLRPSSKYWYAVTSYTIPSQYKIFYRRSTGELDSAMLQYPWTESDISENAQLVTMNFLPSNNLSEIKVVPNPYRADRSYTEPNGFEGSGSSWDFSKRTIWFIHLPEKATITIYTMVGEHVATLYHDDGVRTLHGQVPGQEEWNMSTGSGRPLASGVYVYTVDSNIGKMTGKFVIIK